MQIHGRISAVFVDLLCPKALSYLETCCLEQKLPPQTEKQNYALSKICVAFSEPKANKVTHCFHIYIFVIYFFDFEF